jgi:acyl carrier protein
MLPDELVLLGELPLTENGKLDTHRLQGQPRQDHSGISAAVTTTQRLLLHLWQQILQKNDFGIDQDFFLLGGQSLKLIEMLAEVEQACGRKVRLQEFYREPTIRHLERLIQAQERPCST